MDECGVLVIPGDVTVIETEVDPQTLVLTVTDALVLDNPTIDTTLVNCPSVIILQSNGGSGPTGPPGPSSIENLYIQPTAPTDPGVNYMWIDTTGGNLNFWVETGH